MSSERVRITFDNPAHPMCLIAGQASFVVEWPTPDTVLAIAFAMSKAGLLNGDKGKPSRTLAYLLERLVGLPRSVALRLAFGQPNAVTALFNRAFQVMRQQLPSGDPRLTEPLPFILAGGDAQ